MAHRAFFDFQKFTIPEFYNSSKFLPKTLDLQWWVVRRNLSAAQPAGPAHPALRNQELKLKTSSPIEFLCLIVT
jgi:hypothetical protein